MKNMEAKLLHIIHFLQIFISNIRKKRIRTEHNCTYDFFLIIKTD